MKRILFILCLFISMGTKLYAQDDTEGGSEKIRDKMNLFIQDQLNFSKSEAEQFAPIFLRYFKEWINTGKTIKNDPALVKQQKIVDLRLKYRDLFKDIIGEKRSNEVFDQQRIFIREMRNLQNNRLLERNENIRIRKN